MAIATIQTPDGRTVKIEVPEGATEEEILAFVKAQDLSQFQAPEQPKPVVEEPVVEEPPSMVDQYSTQMEEMTTQGLNPFKPIGLSKLVKETFGVPLDAAASMVGATGEQAIGGIKGLWDTYVGDGLEKGVESIENAQGTPFSAPQTSAGESIVDGIEYLAGKGIEATNMSLSGLMGLKDFALGGGVDNAVDTVNKVQDDGFSAYLGDTLEEAGYSPEIATIARTLPAALVSAIGFKQMPRNPSSKSLLETKFRAGSTDKDVGALRYEPRNKFVEGQRQQLLLENDFADGSSLPQDLAFPRKVVKDSTVKPLLRQGFSEGLPPALRQSTSADVIAFKKQADMTENMLMNDGLKNTVHPLDIAGETGLEQFRFIHKANRQAGRDIGKAVESLKGETVDFSSAVTNFENALKELDIKVNKKDGFSLNFEDSILSGKTLTPARNVLNDVVDYMGKPKKVDAYAVHKLKKYIDEIVDFGKTSKNGMSGTVENVLKDLRHDVDGILDGSFSAYDNANARYSRTIDVMQDFQAMINKKIPLDSKYSDRMVGQELRKFSSNYQKRNQMYMAAENIEKVYREFGGTSDGSLFNQVIMANALDKRFMLARDNTFKGLNMQANTDAFTRAGMTSRTIDYAASKVNKVDDISAMKALRKFLKELEENR